MLNRQRQVTILVLGTMVLGCAGLWWYVRHLTAPGVHDTYGRWEAAERLLREEKISGMPEAEFDRLLGEPDAKSADVWEWNVGTEFSEARVPSIKKLSVSFDKQGHASAVSTRLQD